jgi:general secretion pathway protein G
MLSGRNTGMRRRQSLGFTIIEIMIGVAILGIAATLAFASYGDYRERARVHEAATEIKAMESQIKLYAIDNRSFPPDLAAIGKGGVLDPWGNPYQYLDLTNAKGKGAARKNKNLVPINSDFDLYSMGKDGKSSSPLTAKPSRDDVVRANDGGFVGLAADYDP